MKIAAILETNILTGGGFNQALNAITQIKRLCLDRFEFVVFTNFKKNIKFLNRLGFKPKLFTSGLFDSMLSYATTSPFFWPIQKKFRIFGAFEKALIADDVDLVYFVSPSNLCLSLQRLNYIATVWDLCHGDFPEFPEVREFNQFLKRERLYMSTLKQAIFILTDSNSLSKKLIFRYGIDNKRILSMPFSPSMFIEKIRSIPKRDVMIKYGIEEGFFFYPAQFWAHKNHSRILQALVLLRERGIHLRAVFCGSNQGNLVHIQNQIKRLRLDKNVRILNFVPAEDMRGLYEGCSAVVMPTYFGPTNLPPLEAWQMSKPLIYSSHLSEQAADAALLVNPDSPQDLAEAMQKVLDPSIAKKLACKGSDRLSEIDYERETSEQLMRIKLDTFSKRLKCWK